MTLESWQAGIHLRRWHNLLRLGHIIHTSYQVIPHDLKELLCIRYGIGRRISFRGIILRGLDAFADSKNGNSWNSKSFEPYE